MTDRTSHAGEQHPEEWRQDLNPEAKAGQNYGGVGAHIDPDNPLRTAQDIKLLANAFADDFTDDELKGIPILPEGERLRQGAKYVDLATPDRREFTATGRDAVGRDNFIVPKSEVDYQVWNRLIGVTNPERLGEADEQ
jgi:hypothetical protein